jgi:S1-C subfamily serine protease
MNKLIEEVLKPVVRIRTNSGRGSGTIVKSDEEGTFILTNYHVIGGNIEYKDVWDELVKKDVKKEFTSQVEVDISQVNDIGNIASLLTTNANIVLSNKQRDIALVQVNTDDTTVYPVAKMYPKKICKEVGMLVPMACCGAAMGEKPIVTFGYLNGKQIELDNFEYWLSSANSIFGNSGGGVFTERNNIWNYIGIPSRIAVAFLGMSPGAVSHMGYFIPLFTVYQWLADNCFEFIWGEKTKEQCELERKEKREKELALTLRRDRK